MQLPLIHGREAVPVRLLPFLTSWRPLSPDVVAQLFSKRNEWHEWSISSFNLRPDGAVHELQPRAWNQCDDDLTTLDLDLRGQETFRFQKYAEWRVRSVDLLPPAVFVWRDELEREYTRTFGRMTYPSLRPDAVEVSEEDSEAELELIIRLCRSPETSAEADAAIAKFKESAERSIHYLPGDGELTFAPLLSLKEEAVVFEGFETVRPEVQSTERCVADGQHVASPTVEAAEDRQDRRLRELRAMSGDYVETGVGWRCTGVRGCLARLCEREAAAGRPMSGNREVRLDLRKAVEREIGSRKGRSVFNQA